MAIILRKEKGAPLTSDELDGNFQNINERLCFLEMNPSQAEGIKQMKQINDIVEVVGTFGDVLGRFKLPKLFPRIQGKWEEKVVYTSNDWVIKGDCLFMCCIDHTAEDFETEKAKGIWRELGPMELGPVHREESL